MNARELATRLAALPAADVPAVRLLIELQGEADPEAIMERREEIEDAVDRLEAQLGANQRIVRRCQLLSPIPSRTVPAGF